MEYFFRQLAPLSQKITPRFSVHSFTRTKNPPLKIVKEILYISEYFELPVKKRVTLLNKNYFTIALQQLFPIRTESASVLTV
jgi:hypothetical protein